MLKKIFCPVLIALAMPLKASVNLANIGYVNIEQALSMELDAQKLFKDLETEEQEILNAEQKASAEFEKKFADYPESDRIEYKNLFKKNFLKREEKISPGDSIFLKYYFGLIN